MALPAAVFVAVVLAFLLYRYIIYPAFLSPLAKIPTPHPLAPIVDFWLPWKERGSIGRTLLDAHTRLGPVLRVGPNELHFASLDGLRVIFNTGAKFERSDWWLQFLNYNGTPNLLTMLDAKPHGTRRRMLSLILSKSALLGSVDFQRLSQILLFDRLLPVFEEAAETGQGVDMFEMGCASGVEFVTAYFLGTGNGLDLIRKGKEHERKIYIEAGKKKVLELKGYQEAAKFLEDKTLDMCRKAEDYLTSEKKRKSDDGNEESASTYPVVFAQLRDLIPKKEGPKTPQETLIYCAAETLDNQEAARVAVGGTLTYIFHELTIRPAMQSALRDEVMTLDPPLTYPPGKNSITAATLRKLDSLPLLNAVVTETLRARIPIHMAFRRVVPAGGAVIDGYFVPAGVVVSSSAYPLHMNADAFPEPEKWIPERWLDLGVQGDPTEQVPRDHGEEEKGRASNDPRRWYWAFGSGGRMCAGNNLAVMVMKVIVAATYTNFTTYVIDDEGIEQLDSMVASPAADKLIIGFTKV